MSINFIHYLHQPLSQAYVSNLLPFRWFTFPFNACMYLLPQSSIFSSSCYLMLYSSTLSIIFTNSFPFRKQTPLNYSPSSGTFSFNSCIFCLNRPSLPRPVISSYVHQLFLLSSLIYPSSTGVCTFSPPFFFGPSRHNYPLYFTSFCPARCEFTRTSQSL